jgi:retinol-binding protein 3
VNMVPTHWSRWLLVPALVLLAPGSSPAQILIQGPDKNQPPLPIDSATTNAVIKQALKSLDDDYVFPELAAKMGQAIRKRQASKEYAGIKTGQELAERLTKDLQAVSGDKHLRITCSTQKLPKPPAGMGANPRREIPPEMKERMQRMGQWINGGYHKVERLPGNVGYLAVDGFPPVEAALEPAAAAMNFLANTDALIIDVRENHGGGPESVALLCSYFFDPKPVHLNDLYFRKGNRTKESWTRKEVAGKRYLGKDIYILTSGRTFSAGEEFVYDLQAQKRGVVVGETTGGGAHPGGLRPIGDHFAMFVPSGRAINPITKTDWEGTGVKPDVPVPADAALEKAHEIAIQKLLEKAKDEEARERIHRDVERSRDLQTDKTTTQAH